MTSNQSDAATTASSQNLTSGQSIGNEFSVDFSVLDCDPNCRVQNAIEKFFTVSCEWGIAAIWFFLMFMVIFAILQLICTIIAYVRKRTTLLAPVGSKNTMQSSIFVYALNAVMIGASCAAVILYWKKNYLIYDYAPFLYAGAGYSLILLISTLTTMVYYMCCDYMYPERYNSTPNPKPGFISILWIISIAFEALVCGSYISIFKQSAVVYDSDKILYFFVELLARTFFIVMSYLYTSIAVKAIEKHHYEEVNTSDN
ncbi:uncharacterized protein VICG_01330 [Vittaforma corneae ATCC 50505]|uniref:Uncharacterized protein n=1 Tax=Vittaforma corneae (strain ATCC 50505) TaxID=993615 RepID=L2GMR0_VITCO|nr:uncharacterized protein VICG_01330 [Vittaforma corneae ATCC 50505]ELA41582.1 hypothetical protein VICG_01330 [Vittaforma corneae ATCC 50505]